MKLNPAKLSFVLTRNWLVLALAVALGAPVIAQANPIFTDNFDADSSTTQLNFNSFNNWTVSDGTVDYLRSGAYNISCHGGVGGCVDLDGSTNDAGVLTSITSFHFDSGNAYVLSFWLSGNQRGGSSDSLTFGLDTFAGSLSDIPSDQPFTLEHLRFVPKSDFDSSMYFALAGGDNVGAILDDVSLAPVPEPSDLGLMGLGVILVGVAWRLRKGAAG